MWISKKKYEKLERDLEKYISDSIERQITWARYNINDMVAAVKSQIETDLNDEQTKAIQHTARVFLIDLAEMPPYDFIEALVRKINRVQLKDS